MKLIIAAAAAAATIASASPVAAWTVGDCPGIAFASHHIVAARDRGQQKSDVYLSISRANIPDDIAALLLVVADISYSNWGTTPDQMQTMVLVECLNQFAVNS